MRMRARPLATIRAALNYLPNECRYHCTDTQPNCGPCTVSAAARAAEDALETVKRTLKQRSDYMEAADRLEAKLRAKLKQSCSPPELEALRAFFDVYINQTGTLDPGKVLVSDGVELEGIAALLPIDGALRLDDAAERVLAALGKLPRSSEEEHVEAASPLNDRETP